ncbi:hypothetical protein GCM10010833_25430 [Blastomonas aquatica]|uniref:Sodium:proton antiporter n=1 Tax=Blastomonas aquatica TaxID=1510276 RepID=A0ABQ1JKM1_9SPHN|nr:hypothetical protein GCM10010833_25430 [Blastomonas aquatica]
MVIWLALAGTQIDTLLLGCVVVPLATALSLWLVPSGPPLRIRSVLMLVPRFVWQSLVGGLDVAWRAFHPRLPIDPDWVSVSVALPDGARVALGGELSLMPGTLSAGSQGDRLLIHVLNRDQDVATAVRSEERRFAKALAGQANERSRRDRATT